MDNQNKQSHHRYESATPYPSYKEDQVQTRPQGSRKIQTTQREEHYRTRRYEDSDSGFSSDDEDYSNNNRHRGRRRCSSMDERAPVFRNRSTGHNMMKRNASPRKKRNDSRPPESYTLGKALKAAVMAATVEAVRCRDEPGPWSGQKGKRVAIAAATGGAVGVIRNGRLRRDGKLPIAEAAMTGIYAVDFLKRVLRQTDHERGAEEERRKYRGSSDEEDESEEERRERRPRLRSRSRAESPPVRSRSVRRRATVEYR